MAKKRAKSKARKNPMAIYENRDKQRVVGKVNFIPKDAVKKAEKNLAQKRKEAFKPISKANSIVRSIKKAASKSSKEFSKEKAAMKKKGFKVKSFLHGRAAKHLKTEDKVRSILAGKPASGASAMTDAQKRQAALKKKLMGKHSKIMEAKRVIAAHHGRLPGGLVVKQESISASAPRKKSRKSARKPKLISLEAQVLREKTAGLKGAAKRAAAAKVKKEFAMAKKKKPSAKKKSAKKVTAKKKSAPKKASAKKSSKKKTSKKKSSKKSSKKTKKNPLLSIGGVVNVKPLKRKKRRGSKKSKAKKAKVVAAKPAKKKASKRKASKRKASKKVAKKKVTAKKKASKKVTAKKSGKKVSAKKSGKKHKVKSNPSNGVSMGAKVKEIISKSIRMDGWEAGGLAAGGAAIAMGNSALNAYIPQIRTTLAKVPVLGNFLANNSTGIIALLIGGAGNYFSKDKRVQAIAQGLVAASIVNLGAAVGVEGAKAVGLPAPMSGIIAIPSMNGIVAIPMNGPQNEGDFGALHSNADFGSAQSQADFGSYSGAEFDYSNEY